MVTTEDKLGERARREERRMKRGLGEIESNKQQQQPSTQTHHTATAIDTHSLLSCVASWYVWVSKIDGIPSKGIQSINGPQGSEKRLMTPASPVGVANQKLSRVTSHCKQKSHTSGPSRSSTRGSVYLDQSSA